MALQKMLHRGIIAFIIDVLKIQLLQKHERKVFLTLYEDINRLLMDRWTVQCQTLSNIVIIVINFVIYYRKSRGYGKRIKFVWRVIFALINVRLGWGIEFLSLL